MEIIVWKINKKSLLQIFVLAYMYFLIPPTTKGLLFVRCFWELMKDFQVAADFLTTEFPEMGFSRLGKRKTDARKKVREMEKLDAKVKQHKARNSD